MIRWRIKGLTVVVLIKPLEERHVVTFAVIAMLVGMLLMAREDPDLWEVELFKTLLTAFGITGFLNMVLSFHFSANKRDEQNAQSASRALDAAAQAALATATADESDPNGGAKS